MSIKNKVEKLIRNNQISEAIKILEESPSFDNAFIVSEIYGDKASGEFYSPEKSFNIIQDLNKKKYIPAKFRLGQIYVKGEFDKDFNFVEADTLFRSVANLTGKDREKYFDYVTKSCLEIAKIYENGYIEQDKKEALRYYKKATENKDLVYAFYKCGQLILEIDPSNYSEALSYLNESNSSNLIDSIRLSTKIYLKLSKRNVKNLSSLDPHSVDYKILGNKLNNIDEDLL